MNRQPNKPFAVIDFGRTPSVCMDIHCPCGFHAHLDTYGEMGSAEFVRCPDCKEVLRIGADVNLLDTKEDFSINRGAHTFIQWKGTDVVMQANCTCGQAFAIERDFAYECDCPQCGKHYHCESSLEVAKLSPEEAATVAKIQEPEKDYEDMSEEEQAAYDAKNTVVTTTAEMLARDVLMLGHTHRCGGECDQSQANARRAVEVGHLVVGGAGFGLVDLLSRTPPAQVVMLGDYIDGAAPVMPDITGGRVLVLPDIHVADFGTRRSVANGDIADLFMTSRWPGKGDGNIKKVDNSRGNRQQRRKNRRGK